MEPTLDPSPSPLHREPALSTTAPAEAESDAPSLERLEADVAAVESAMESIDRIAAGAEPGLARAAQIDAVASAQRFPLASDAAPASTQAGLVPEEDGRSGAGPGSQLVGDRLLDQ